MCCRWTVAFAGLLLLGVLTAATAHFTGSTVASAEKQAPQLSPAELQAEVADLKSMLPDQSHAMHDVAYHYTNLWFAAAKENWPLAMFYWGETRAHLRWAVHLKPIRKDNKGQPIELAKILEALENGPLGQVKTAIDAKDKTQFETAYRTTLEGCYSCHKASDKPYLRPQVPESPEVRIINFDPAASWPK